MRNYWLMGSLIILVVVVLGYAMVKQFMPAPNTCAFKELHFQHTEISDSISARLAGDLSVSLGQLKKWNSPVSIKATKGYRVSFDRLSRKYSTAPYDTILAQEYNQFAHLICDLYAQHAKEKEKERKKKIEHEIDRTIKQYIDVFLDYKEKNTDNLVKLRYEKSMNEFFTLKINASRDEYEKDYWQKMHHVMPTYLNDCNSREDFSNCLDKLWLEVRNLSYEGGNSVQD